MVGVTFQALVARAASTPASISFIGSTENTTDGTSFTFTNHAIGTANATRRVVVVCHFFAASNTVTSATIQGISATIHVQATEGGATNAGIAIISALVPTGTTATIVLNLSASSTRAYVGVFSALHESVSSPFATATDITLTSSTTLDINANTSAGGWIVSGTTMGGATAGRTYTWTGVTESYDANSGELNTRSYSGGCSTGLVSTETPRTVTVVCSGAQDSGCGATMSWI